MDLPITRPEHCTLFLLVLGRKSTITPLSSSLRPLQKMDPSCARQAVGRVSPDMNPASLGKPGARDTSHRAHENRGLERKRKGCAGRGGGPTRGPCGWQWKCKRNIFIFPPPSDLRHCALAFSFHHCLHPECEAALEEQEEEGGKACSTF